MSETPAQTVDATVDTPWTRRTVDTPGGVRSPGSPGPTDRERAWRGDPAEIVTAGSDVDYWLDRITRALPSWHADAACIGTDVSLFFPPRGGRPAAAVEICAGCAAIEPCLAEALADPSLDHGIRAGLTADQRRKLRRAGRGEVP